MSFSLRKGLAPLASTLRGSAARARLRPRTPAPAEANPAGPPNQRSTRKDHDV